MAAALEDIGVARNLRHLALAEKHLTFSRQAAQRLLEQARLAYLAFARENAPVEQVERHPRPALASARDLDQVLTEVSAAADSSHIMREVAISLVALRRALLPDAAPYMGGALAPEPSAVSEMERSS